MQGSAGQREALAQRLGLADARAAQQRLDRDERVALAEVEREADHQRTGERTVAGAEHGGADCVACGCGCAGRRC